VMQVTMSEHHPVLQKITAPTATFASIQAILAFFNIKALAYPGFPSICYSNPKIPFASQLMLGFSVDRRET